MYAVNEVPGPTPRSMTHALCEAGATQVPPERFRDELEREARRHARYLSGVALACVGSAGGPEATAALREAIETETRRTDVVSHLPDGSWALLVVNAADREVETVVRRLRETAADLADLPDGGRGVYFAAATTAGHRRLEADELWESLAFAFREARAHRADLVFGAWD